MTLRSEAPSGTPDPFIAAYAENSRAAARQALDWALDGLRVHAGLAEVVDPDEPEVPLSHRTRHLLKPATRAMRCTRPCATRAHFHFVRDKAAA